MAAVGSAGFAPNDPLAVKQWYLGSIHAFDAWPELPATLSPIRVAVVDSGLDVDHPDFAGHVAGAQTFVGGDALDRQGHGTFVAGLIAGNSPIVHISKDWKRERCRPRFASSLPRRKWTRTRRTRPLA